MLGRYASTTHIPDVVQFRNSHQTRRIHYSIDVVSILRSIIFENFPFPFTLLRSSVEISAPHTSPTLSLSCLTVIRMCFDSKRALVYLHERLRLLNQNIFLRHKGYLRVALIVNNYIFKHFKWFHNLKQCSLSQI